MRVVARVLLSVVSLSMLAALQQPVLSAVRPVASAEAVYTLRVERGKTKRIRFSFVEPRGDSLIEADQFDLVVAKEGVTIRPSPPTHASSHTGAELNFQGFELFLPTDGSSPVMKGTLAR